MKEKLFSFGDNFWIENDAGRRAYKVNGKVLRIRDTLDIEDPQGRILVKIQSKLITIKDQIKLDRVGAPGAVVKKDMINIVRDHMVMKMDQGPDIDIRGNLFDHEYTFTRGRDKVAEVSNKWFRLRDTDGVQIQPGEDEVFFLAATVAVDQLFSDVV